MKTAKIIIIIIVAVIVGNIILLKPVLHIHNECAVYFHKKTFLKKYEFEDFSQFENVNIFIRGGDRERRVIMMDAPLFVKDAAKAGLYIVTFDKKKHQVIETKWALTKDDIEADTVKLQQLAQTFIKYEIPRLDVDRQGNVFVYVKDVETLAFVRFANESELLEHSREKKWKRIKGNWYKLQN